MADAQLHRSMEKVFASTEARVVAAYKVYYLLASDDEALKLRRRYTHVLLG